MLKAYLFNDYTTALAAVEYVNGHWRIENGPENNLWMLIKDEWSNFLD